MKIRSIELLEVTESYFLTKITFEEASWGIRTIEDRKCYSKKNGSITSFLDTGDMIPIYLHESVRVFLDTGKKSMRFID